MLVWRGWRRRREQLVKVSPASFQLLKLQLRMSFKGKKDKPGFVELTSFLKLKGEVTRMAADFENGKEGPIRQHILLSEFFYKTAFPTASVFSILCRLAQAAVQRLLRQKDGGSFHLHFNVLSPPPGIPFFAL